MNKKILYDINDDMLNDVLADVIDSGRLVVVGASGSVNDSDLLSKMRIVRQRVEQDKNFNGAIKKHYFDDGVNFTETISFIKKPSK